MSLISEISAKKYGNVKEGYGYDWENDDWSREAAALKNVSDNWTAEDDEDWGISTDDNTMKFDGFISDDWKVKADEARIALEKENALKPPVVRLAKTMARAYDMKVKEEGWERAKAEMKVKEEGWERAKAEMKVKEEEWKRAKAEMKVKEEEWKRAKAEATKVCKKGSNVTVEAWSVKDMKVINEAAKVKKYEERLNAERERWERMTVKEKEVERAEKRAMMSKASEQELSDELHELLNIQAISPFNTADDYNEVDRKEEEWGRAKEKAESDAVAVVTMKALLSGVVTATDNKIAELCGNPNAIHMLEKNLDKVDWSRLSENPNAIHILGQNLDRVDWDNLSRNPNAIPILEKNLDYVNWDNLSENPNAIPMLEKNLDRVTWDNLSRNPNAIPILEKNLDQVDWGSLSSNPNAFPLLEQNLDEVDWDYLSQHPHPQAIHMLEQNLDKVNWKKMCGNPNAIHILKKNLWRDLDWRRLCGNPNAIPILEKNLDKVNWRSLSQNPNAIPMLEQNLDKVDWEILSRNPNAIPMLEKNLDKVSWYGLSSNPNAIPILEKKTWIR